MREKTCCFTGHRLIPTNDYQKIMKCLETEVTKLIHQGVSFFCAGGAFGFDTLAALTVLKLKPEYLHIRLILVLPCKEQAARWSDNDKETYNRILNAADEAIYTSEHYHSGCMHKRNCYLIDNSSICTTLLLIPLLNDILHQ